MATPLSTDEIKNALNGLSGWQHENDMLTKTYEFDHYLAGVAFASATGTICQGMGHHPDMAIGYKKVTVSFTTHDAGSKVTQMDIDAAKALESIGYPK
ncbi:MAG: 4a-hydroxytetrahydrobiopterin dehydratase [Chloroflexota bacterium]